MVLDFTSKAACGHILFTFSLTRLQMLFMGQIPNIGRHHGLLYTVNVVLPRLESSPNTQIHNQRSFTMT